MNPDPDGFDRRIARGLSSLRREQGARSPEAFARVYLADFFRLPSSRMHRELFAALADMTANRGSRLAFAAPRGHAKTTVAATAYVLWCLLYGHEPYVLLVSATSEQAVQLLKPVKDQLRANPLLAEDFPEVCGPPVRNAGERWRGNEIVLRGGVAGVTAVGARQAFRGRKQGRHRPTLIVVDDLETLDGVQSAEQREKTEEWFEKTLVPAGQPMTNVVMVGTVLHHDALLAKKLDPARSGGWTGRRYQAVEAWSERPELWEAWEAVYRGQREHEGAGGAAAAEAFFRAQREAMLAGTRVLWPEQEDYYQLMLMRLRGGHASFQSEKQNDPQDPTRCVFRPDAFRYWDDDHRSPADLLAHLGGGRHVRVYGACDPSLGRHGGTGDFTAIVTVARDVRENRYYVLDADVARRTPDQIVERIIQLAGVYRYTSFAVESNQFQALLADNLRRRARERGMRLQVQNVTNRTEKQSRIEGLEALASQGTLVFSRRHVILLDQLRAFPLGDHDDGPDALEMAVAAAHYTPRPAILFFDRYTGRLVENDD